MQIPFPADMLQHAVGEILVLDIIEVGNIVEQTGKFNLRYASLFCLPQGYLLGRKISLRNVSSGKS